MRATPTGPDEKAAVDGGENGVSHDRMRRLEVVVIEDNADVGDTLGEWLEEEGHHVRIARTGEQGLRLVREARPTMVICDLGLPEMDGLEVGRAIRALALDPQPVLVAITGWGDGGDRQRTKDAGFDHHLVKPVSPDELFALLQNLPA